MSVNYAKKTWQNNEILLADDLNHIEKGIADIYEKMRLAESRISTFETPPYKIEGLSDLEKELYSRYQTARTGKVFATRMKRYSKDTNPKGEYILDSVGKTCTASTDTVEGQDDFLNENVFMWERCNYIRDADTTARVTAIEGRSGFKETGSVDVGTIMPTFWWKQEIGENYITYYVSDMPHAELGLVPWCEAVKADGTILPYYIGSAYPSVVGDDGLPRSLPNKSPAYNQSHNNMCTEYAKKGEGYHGAGSERNLFALIMSVIKYRTMNVDYISKGCTGFSAQVKCAVAETGVKRILLTNNSTFYLGACVSVSTGGLTSAPDRGSANCHTKADRVRVKSIEEVTVSGTKYYAYNLDTSAAFDTTTDTYVSAMPCFTGETNKVIGKHDGAYISNTNSQHIMRICGREYLGGQGMIFGGTALKFQDKAWHVLKAPKGVKANSSLTDYVDTGVAYDYNDGKDTYQGDLVFNAQYGTYAMLTKGDGSTLGVGDIIWEGGTGRTDGELREFYSGGYLRDGSRAGLASVNCGPWLGNAWWAYGSFD